jgi:hypothetical protein
MDMKRLLAIGFLALLFSACADNYYEPRYDPRDKLVGYYEVEEYSETYNDITYYTLRISKSGYDREIYLSNFYDSDLRVYAILDYDKITIPFQVVDGFQIEGIGAVHGNELDLSYSIKDRYNNFRTDFCETKAWFDY